jgi:hypothetical protein
MWNEIPSWGYHTIVGACKHIAQGVSSTNCQNIAGHLASTMQAGARFEFPRVTLVYADEFTRDAIY